MNDTPKLPSPEDIHKFEVREQPGMSKNQAEHATAWLNLTQLLEKIVFILNGFRMDEVVAHVSTSENLNLGETALKENERWKEIFALGLKHHEDVLRIFVAQRDLSVKMRELVTSMTKLKTDESIIAETERFVKALDALEVHRKSGLLEIISKL